MTSFLTFLSEKTLLFPYDMGHIAESAQYNQFFLEKKFQRYLAFPILWY
jgi:hypothetical protein